MTLYRTLYDDRYGYPGFFNLVRCTDCGHKSLEAEFDAESLSRLYTTYYPRSSFEVDRRQPLRERGGLTSWLHGDHSFAWRWVPRNVRVLDIGCGFGETLEYHRSRGCDVYGVEADENIRRVAEKFGYKVHVGLFDPRIYEPGFFDCVTMDQVIEHLADPIRTLRGVARILKPAGRLVVGTPNSNGWGTRIFGGRWISWHAPYHLHLFSTESMRRAAAAAELRLDRAVTITSSHWLNLQWCHLLTAPPMGVASPYWSPKAEAGRSLRWMVGALESLGILKINHGITRLFDSLGIGDNHLFVLTKS